MLKEKNKKNLSIFPMQKKFSVDKLTLNDLWNGDELPFSLKSSLAFIYQYHLKTINVFRRNGNEIAHESICNGFKKNMHAQPFLSLSMIFDICSAIKAYVRDIPNGLMEKKLQREWYKTARLINSEDIKKRLKILVQKLPQANRNLLFHFLVLISAIVENQKENTMSSKSLSIVFLPSFFEKVINITDIKDLPYFMELLETMILNAKFLIEPDIFMKIEKSFKEIGKDLVIQSSHLPEEKTLEVTKRIQFPSQDSGLNSTSFLDDKGSQSQSSSRQAFLNDKTGNSMEDLLNESDCINTATSNELEENKLHKSDSVLSISSISSNNENNNSNILLRSGKYHQKCHASKLNGSFSCIGTQVHSINECRLHSIHNNRKSGYDKWDDIKQNSCCYEPVYNRSCFNIDCNFESDKSLVNKEDKNNEQNSYFVQRKKPIIKRSSCIIRPFERKNKSVLNSSIATTVEESNVISETLSCNESCPPLPSSYLTVNSNKSSKNIVIKYKTKRNFHSNWKRFTAPIKLSEDIQETSLNSLSRPKSVYQSDIFNQ